MLKEKNSNKANKHLYWPKNSQANKEINTEVTDY